MKETNGVSAGSKGNYAKDLKCDILIIGAGFSGCFLLHYLRKKGFNVKIYEMAEGLGGVWRWNRYPGARVDTEVPFYELSIPEVYETWNWTQRFPDWKELQQYFDHIDKVCQISKDVAFNTKVVEAQFDTEKGKWTTRTEDGRTCESKYLLPCVGFAAKKYFPNWKGLDKFKGEIHHSALWPLEDVDVTGKRCAVIGTGSTGVQITQEWAKKAKSLIVFQRTPNLAIPMGQRKLTPADRNIDECAHKLKDREEGFGGLGFPMLEKNTFDDPPEVRESVLQNIWDKGNFEFWVGIYKDYLYDAKSNRVIYDFWANKRRQKIKDPKKRDILAPLEPPHPFGTKRPSLEQDYFDMFNKPNVDVISLKNNPIAEFTEKGIVLQDGSSYELDVVAVATGFDAVTGSMIAAGIKNIDGTSVEELWKNGVQTYLGIAAHGFPNMFFTYGPQAPTAFSNGPTCTEVQSRFIIDTIEKMEKENIKYINPTKEAQDKFVDQIHDYANKSLFPLAESWYMGANIPGKKKEMLNYLGGIPLYRKTLEDTFNDGFTGFKLVK